MQFFQNQRMCSADICSLKQELNDAKYFVRQDSLVFGFIYIVNCILLSRAAANPLSLFVYIPIPIPWRKFPL